MSQKETESEWVRKKETGREGERERERTYSTVSEKAYFQVSQ